MISIKEIFCVNVFVTWSDLELGNVDVEPTNLTARLLQLPQVQAGKTNRIKSLKSWQYKRVVVQTRVEGIDRVLLGKREILMSDRLKIATACKSTLVNLNELGVFEHFDKFEVGKYKARAQRDHLKSMETKTVVSGVSNNGILSKGLRIVQNLLWFGEKIALIDGKGQRWKMRIGV